MKTAKESYQDTKKDTTKLLEALLKACEAKVQEACAKGLFNVHIKGNELDNKFVRDQLSDKLTGLGYHVVKVVTIKLVNDVKISEDGEFLIKWGTSEDLERVGYNGEVVSIAEEPKVEFVGLDTIKPKKPAKFKKK